MNSSLKLTTQTPLGKEELKKINNILTSLFDNQDSYEFRNPVDWKGNWWLTYRYGSLRLSIDNQESNRPWNNQEEVDNEQIPVCGGSTWRYSIDMGQLQNIQFSRICKQHNIQWIHALADKLDKASKKMFKNYLPNIQFLMPGSKNTII